MRVVMEIQVLEMVTIVKRLFDVLKKEGIPKQDYYVVLVLLSVYKEEVTAQSSEVNAVSEPNIQLEDAPFLKREEAIANYFDAVLSVLKKKGAKEIFDVFSAIEKEYFTTSFSALFDELLFQIVKSQEKAAGEFIQPIEITRLICGLITLKSDSKVFNPFAGLASFATHLAPSQHYYGQEQVVSTWVIGRLRLLAYGKIAQTSYVCENSLVDWPVDTEKFDCVFSNPPFGRVVDYSDEILGCKVKTAEQYVLLRGLTSLSSDGKLVIVLPQAFLYRAGHDQQLRKLLLDNDWLETVISLPGGILSHTNTPIALLVLDKAKQQANTVRLVKGKDFVLAKGSRDKVLDDLAFLSFLAQGNYDHDKVRLVSCEEIVAQKYNFTVERYFVSDYVLALKKQGTARELCDFLTIVKGVKVALPVHGKLIRNRDLKENRIDYHLDLLSIELEKITVSHVRKVEQSCLLLATVWDDLKPTYFQYTGEPIYVPQDIVCFAIDENVVDRTYLISELSADYVLEQLEALRVGATIQRISHDDLKSIVIAVPSMIAQVATAKGILETAGRIKILEEERDALLLGNSSEKFNEFASLKHTLGRPRQNILDWSVNLSDFLGDSVEQIGELNKAFASLYELDIFEALREIKREVSFITEVLEKGEHGFIVSDYKKELISLAEMNSFIKSYSSNSSGFKIVKELLSGEDLQKRGILANKVLLKTLIDNILTNARKYAFDNISDENEVVIALHDVQGFLVLEIKNNGKSFPNNFDRAKFIAKYSTANRQSGTGLGGYDIHRIAKYMESKDWTLDLDNDPNYTVKFKFQFPIKLIE